MFKLTSFLDISGGQPGMLIPLISSPNTNLPYVQQMDEYLVVKALVPFLEYENYSIVQTTTQQNVVVGDQGLVAFRLPDGTIFSGNVAEVLEYIEAHEELIARSVCLRTQLNRVRSAEYHVSYDGWRDVANSVFDDPEQRKLWLDAEMSHFQKQDLMWEEIDPAEPASDEDKKAGLQGSLDEYGLDFLILWLSRRANFEAKGWTSVWHHVNAAMPFDERLSELGVTWMYAMSDQDPDLQQSKTILYSLLQRQSALAINWSDLAKFLGERFGSDPFLIFGYMRPPALFSTLLRLLAVQGFADDAIKLIQFCISEVPKDEFVSVALQDAIQAMLAERSNDDVARDQDQEWVKTLQALSEQVRAFQQQPERASF